MLTVLRVTTFAAMLWASFTHAHHGYDTAYDGGRLLTLKGSVVAFAVENPHSRIVVEVKDARGNSETWTVETVPASRVAQMQHPLGRVNLKPGAQVTVTGWPARDGSKRLGGHTLTPPDGAVIMLRPAIHLPARRD
jgi:hypothetical protein